MLHTAPSGVVLADATRVVDGHDFASQLRRHDSCFEVIRNDLVPISVKKK